MFFQLVCLFVKLIIFSTSDITMLCLFLCDLQSRLRRVSLSSPQPQIYRLSLNYETTTSETFSSEISPRLRPLCHRHFPHRLRHFRLFWSSNSSFGKKSFCFLFFLILSFFSFSFLCRTESLGSALIPRVRQRQRR